MKRLLLATLVLLCSTTLLATNDEIVLGHYSHSSKGFSIAFEWKLDGISNVRVNNARYPGPFPYNNHGIFENVGVYSFTVDEGSIFVFVAFADRGVKTAAGIYQPAGSKKGARSFPLSFTARPK